jgi:hypothetical protein
LFKTVVEDTPYFAANTLVCDLDVPALEVVVFFDEVVRLRERDTFFPLLS